MAGLKLERAPAGTSSGSGAARDGAIRALALAMLMLAAVTAPRAGATKQTDPLGLLALRNFAICSVGRNADGAANLLAMDVGSSDYKAALKRYAKGHDYCAPGSRLQFGGLLFAGDLAEALIASRYRGGTALDTLATQPAPPALSGDEAVGACVTRERPEAVRALIATDPGSTEELKALQQTGDVLSGCVAKGRAMKLNRPAIRAIYALGAYRLLTAAPAMPVKEG